MYDLMDFNYFDSENDYYDDTQDFEEYDDDDFQDENFTDVWNNCVLLSSQSILPLMWRLMFSNISFGLLVSSVKISEPIFHLLSGLTGIYLASEVESTEGKSILIIYLIVSYLIIIGTHFIHKKCSKDLGPIVKVFFIASLIFSQHLFIKKEVFLRIRGILMIIVMKILHLIDETFEKGEFPSVLQYFGYTLCSANILFGPWTTYQEYKELHSQPKKKNAYWILGIFKSFTLSLTCLTISNCWAAYLISGSFNRWLLAYRDALSFRFSHYFVSYLAEMSMISAGFKNFNSGGKLWSYTVVSPLDIEFPTSLATVVTKWNQPIHLFLKNTIYLPMRKYGQFSAIMATFLVSSFLHGFEVRVSVVLLSLGVFSFLQVKSRILISDAMDACLNVKPCKQCTHKYGRDNFGVRTSLLLFAFDSILHLAYLGILMDPALGDLSIYEQWSDLYFISHIIMFVNFLLII
ncbi:protein-serine O-palmitoleoyltransferase porcupine [Coccinella septempunctata]|uniref:protein-serine O-palmitoleoyltransferase porcupine n=1 Tax=Coccinella septempunctata TaxID=41139 RepID=UPI001D064537|nr:protein-serine O-palmitoleoyltransferase porcupine [Coccinella septempunctata]